MPDWNALVRERLGGLNLPPVEREEIIAELASHLHEAYEDGCRRGLANPEAVQHAVSELGDMDQLARNICHAKKERPHMGDRMKTFWLPGLASLAAFNLLWMGVTRADLAPHLFDFGSIIVPVYFPLLLAMPLFGALGAFLSFRAGGSRRARFTAGLFPMLAIPAAALTAMGANIVLNLKLLSPTPHTFPTRGAVAIVVLAGVAIQTTALLLGALPFLNAKKRDRQKA